jgi:hypothetical protein
MQTYLKSRIPSTIDVPQVAALRPPIKLDRARASTHFRPPEAEHARSHGTAASAAGNSCCLQFALLNGYLLGQIFGRVRERLFPEWRESVWGKDFLGWGWGGMLLRSKIA